MPGHRNRNAIGIPLVAHVINRLDTGGLESVMVELINATGVSELHHVVICLAGYSEFRKRINIPNVKCYTLDKKPGKDPFAYWRLWLLLHRLRPDVVQTYNIGTIDAAVPAWLAGVRAIVHAEHGRNADDPMGLNKKYNRLRRSLNPLIKRYIAVSGDLERWLINVVGLPGNKVARIYNGVDVTRFMRPKNSDMDRRRVLPKDFALPGIVVFINVGRLDPVKDQAGLVYAFTAAVKELGEGGAKLRLVIVGDGPERMNLERLVDVSGVASQILLMGQREDVPSLLAAADVFVSSSITEGIAMTVLEAMACARPVIATAVGGSPEVVVDNQTGVLVPSQATEALSTAMCQYVTDRQLATQHGIAGRARVVECFALDQMVRSYVDLYDELTCADSSLQNRVV